MTEKRLLAEQIVKEAANIPLESQRHILSVINAMVFTRDAIRREEAPKSRKGR